MLNDKCPLVLSDKSASETTKESLPVIGQNELDSIQTDDDDDRLDKTLVENDNLLKLDDVESKDGNQMTNTPLSSKSDTGEQLSNQSS